MIGRVKGDEIREVIDGQIMYGIFSYRNISFIMGNMKRYLKGFLGRGVDFI